MGFATNIIAQLPNKAPSPAQPPADYDLRWGVKIPMRDKVELNATLYLPKTPDGSPPKTPVIFTLTPYISDMYHARAAYFASHGYVFALVDVRGAEGARAVRAFQHGSDPEKVPEPARRRRQTRPFARAGAGES